MSKALFLALAWKLVGTLGEGPLDVLVNRDLIISILCVVTGVDGGLLFSMQSSRTLRARLRRHINLQYVRIERCPL